MDTVERIVVTDIYAWMTPLPGRIVGQHNIAYRGELIKISAEEAERGDALGALGSGAEAIAAAAKSSEPASWSDTQVNSAKPDELLAYLGQHPSQAERIRQLEAERKRPRKSIAEAVERVIAARDEAIAAAAERRDLELAGAGDDDDAEAMRALAGGAPTVPGNAG